MPEHGLFGIFRKVYVELHVLAMQDVDCYQISFNYLLGEGPLIHLP